MAYPDSADLFQIGEVIRSGYIYPDISRPPYQVTLYGPLTYILLGIPYRLAQAAGITPQVLVRLSVVGAFSFCVLLMFLVSRRLHSSRPMAWLCALFAVSAFPLASWTTQIRGDFLALAFSFLSLYLFLLTNGRPQVIGAAICGGIAVLVKQTFLAVPIAIITWLIYRRRHKEAVFWTAGFALTVVGGYVIAGSREPLILQHMAALRHPLLEYQEGLVILWHALGLPVVPFAAIGGFLVFRKGAPEEILFLFYCVVAWLIAVLTISQVGANINYFWEPILASAVLAGPGLWELQRRLNRAPMLVTVMLLFLLLRSSLPILRQELDYLGLCHASLSDYQVRKARWSAFVSTVSGRRLLSTIPDVTVHSVAPEIPDPYLNAVLELRGRWNSDPVKTQIDAGAYDLIVIRKGEAEAPKYYAFRGVWNWNDAMWGALKRAYGPACVFEGMEVWLPNPGSGEILHSLSGIGCLAEAREAETGSAVGSQIH